MIYLFFFNYFYNTLLQNFESKIEDKIKNKEIINYRTSNANESIIQKKRDIEKHQINLRKIFEQKENIEPFKIKSYDLKRGDIVYAFVLDTSTNYKPFQEGIVSENYSKDQIDALGISIKGKNNKIFFNQKWEFIGISIPYQENSYGINYILTSNKIFHFLNRYANQIPNEKITNKITDSNKFEQKPKNYYLPITCEIKNSENQKVAYKDKICLNEKGFFMGLNSVRKKLFAIQKPNFFLSDWAALQNFIFNYFNHILIDLSKAHQHETEKDLDEYQTNEDETKINKFEKISKISFYIEVPMELNNNMQQYNGGSGFIYKAQKKEDGYEYFVLTNKHVITEHASKENIKLYNDYFVKENQEIKIKNIIRGNEHFDDIAILKFTDEDDQKFQEIEKILKEVILKNYKNLNILQGDSIYSLGSQINQIPYIAMDKFYSNPNHLIKYKLLKKNLLKKGNVVLQNAKEIHFDINIDSGNSGGPIFNEKGQIIGMNKSILIYAVNSPQTNNFSQAIPIDYILKIIENPQDDIDKLEKEIINFLKLEKNLNNPNENKQNILSIYSIFTDKLKKILSTRDTHITSEILVPKQIGDQQIVLNIEHIKTYDDKEHILTLDPLKEIIEISLSQRDNNVIIFKKINQTSQEKTIKKLKLSSDLKSDDFFFHFELVNKNFNKENKNKIVDSLIVWNKGQYGGNGIIFYKKKLKNKPNHFLYLVLSNYENTNNNLFDNVIEKIKNLFINNINIIIVRNEDYQEEKGKIDSFYLKNNMVLISFESSKNYNVINIRDIEDLKLGEEMYFVINTHNEKYFPQFFKGNIGYIFEETKKFLIDCVFNTKKNNMMNYVLENKNANFLCFDNQDNFVGFNEIILNNDNSNINIANFIKFATTEQNKIKILLKDIFNQKNLTIVLSIIFLTISSIILIIIIKPLKKHLPK
ncbi:MAG: S1C family serine protease [Vigna little leaf phytoplasma]|nr:S1C family serine protease [Vigna little leaf phytoplasma]